MLATSKYNIKMEIKIFGHTGIGNQAAATIAVLEQKTGAKIIIIDDMFQPENIIEINGIKYKKRVQEKNNRSGYMNGIGAMVMAFQGAMSMLHNPYGISNYERKRPKVDILSEYILVLQKKSKLSKSDRDWVEHQFNRLYVPF